MRVIGCLLLFTSMVMSAQERRPDLTVVSTRIEGGKVIVTVANRGAAAPTVRPMTTLLAGGRSFDAVTPALSPGQTTDVAFDVVLTAGATYQVMVDSGRVVDESDETNNRTLNQTVPGAAPAAGVTVDPSLSRHARGIRLPRLEGHTRTAAVARFPNGDLVPFVENELLLTTKDAGQAKAVAARWNGSIVRIVERAAPTDRGPTFVIRVSTGQAPPNVFTPRENGFVFSSDTARNLLAIAMTERGAGAKVGINLILKPAGLLEKKTVEAKGANALELDYMRSGGPLDVNVADAWAALFTAGKTASKPIRIAVIDSGFALGTPGFTEPDIDAVSISGTGSMSTEECCPWHGHEVSEAAAGVQDNKSGWAGPGGPVARIMAIDPGGYSTDGLIAALKLAKDGGADIINMSFGYGYPRSTGTFENAWMETLIEWEKDTVLLNTLGYLLFASAGNEDQNVDAVNSDGDETHWYAPCENQGVICVGGWNGGPNLIGQLKDSGSNYGTGKGETVDIFGPMTVRVSDVPGDEEPALDVSGTSYSSPFAAGVAALIWAANSDLNNAQVWGLMQKHAITVKSNFRRVHAFRAVREALTMQKINFKPAVSITGIGSDGQLKQMPLKLTAIAFDVEDSNCCNAQWTINGQPAGSGFAIEHDFGKDPLGQKTIAITVTDTAGQSATASVTKWLINLPPKVTIISAPSAPLATNQQFIFGAEVKDDTSLVNLPIGECAKVKWTVGNTHLATGCQPTLAFTTPGTRTVTATYTDAHGGSGSANVKVTVNDVAKLIGSIVLPQQGSSFRSLDPILVQIQKLNASGATTEKWTLTNLKTNETRPVTVKNATFRIADVFVDIDGTSDEIPLRLTLTLLGVNGVTSDPHSVTITKTAHIH